MITSLTSKKLKKLVLVAALLAASATLAQDVMIQGVGTLSCGKYLQMRAAEGRPQNAVLVSWIWGYMSGFNMEVKVPTVRELPDEPSTLAYIDKYCKEQPLQTVLIATYSLIGELGGKRNPR